MQRYNKKQYKIHFSEKFFLLKIRYLQPPHQNTLKNEWFFWKEFEVIGGKRDKKNVQTHHTKLVHLHIDTLAQFFTSLLPFSFGKRVFHQNRDRISLFGQRFGDCNRFFVRFLPNLLRELLGVLHNKVSLHHLDYLLLVLLDKWLLSDNPYAEPPILHSHP
jgi:hypothetical protein